jgi:hypothetical protein
MARPTIDELERREADGRDIKPEKRVSYHIEIRSDGSLAECEVIYMVNGRYVSIVDIDGKTREMPEADEMEHDRFIVKGDVNGDPKLTAMAALVAARDRLGGFYHPSIVS